MSLQDRINRKREQITEKLASSVIADGMPESVREKVLAQFEEQATKALAENAWIQEFEDLAKKHGCKLEMMVTCQEGRRAITFNSDLDDESGNSDIARCGLVSYVYHRVTHKICVEE